MATASSRAARSRAASVRVKERSGRIMKNDPHPNGGDGKSTLDDATAGSLDKVRDILFGAQVRDADRRFARLEERLSKEAADLKDDVRKRLGVLEQFVKSELESLAERLKSEHEARTDAVKDLSRELRDASKASEKKFGQVDDQLARVQRELRQQLLDTHQKITDEMQRQAQDGAARLARESSELRTEKVDRAALAAMLTDIAMRLTDDLTPGAAGE
jgi:DNA anti-recombination protein RmuC